MSISSISLQRLAGMALPVAMLGMLALPASAQPQRDPNWVHPETPWGDPDLQGVWPGNMGVPMQRPPDLADKPYLSETEFQERQDRAREQAAADNEAFDDEGGGSVGIGPPSYWTERGEPVRQTSLIVSPANGRLPELAWTGIQHRALTWTPGEWRDEADTWEDMNIYYRCITRGLLGSMIPVVYNNGNQIVQGPGYVVLRNEMIHEARVIPLDGRDHVGEEIRSYMGDSRGHWEGNTLVVETTNFTDKIAIGSNGAGYPGDPGYHSASMRLVERFERLGENTLVYQATINDPHMWSEPWTMQIELNKEDDYQFLEYACHEGNYAMHDILSGARVEEGAIAPLSQE